MGEMAGELRIWMSILRNYILVTVCSEAFLRSYSMSPFVERILNCNRFICNAAAQLIERA
jgi:hypothetical protein